MQQIYRTLPVFVYDNNCKFDIKLNGVKFHFHCHTTELV